MNILLSAIEPSADRLGAELLAELARRGVRVRVRGLGGPLLQAQGLIPVAPLAPAAMGFIEVLRHLGALRRRAGRRAERRR